MKKRTFDFDGSDGAAQMMALILRHYADAAYPIGGSECAAASREALAQIADNLLQAEASNMPAQISRRQRPMLKSAVSWFFKDSIHANPADPMYNRLLSQFVKK